jgi:hypothetical protein
LDWPGEKLLIKLWETLAEKGIGSLLSPWQTTRDGKARIELRRQEMLMLAQAEVDVEEIRAGRKRTDRDGRLLLLTCEAPDNDPVATDSAGSIDSRICVPSLVSAHQRGSAAEDARKEINSTKAVIYAEEALSSDPQKPPDRSIDDDWIFTWRDYAGGVSTEDLQRLWGKVLAGEVKSPGTYSLRTLEFLKGLSRGEAEKIGKLASFVIEGRIIRSLSQYLEEQGITFSLLLEMQELGLLVGVEAVGLKTVYKSWAFERFAIALRSNGKVLVVEDDDAAKVLSLEVYVLTRVGQQLVGLGSFPSNVDYLRLAGKEIIKKGFRVKLADWVQLTEHEGQYSNGETLDA